MEIQRLNMDNSWRLRIGGISLLIDPWLEGKETDYFSWFNTQWHRTKPIDYQDLPAYDFVLITQKYPDHFHQQTLLKIQPEKLIVPATIEKKVRAFLPDALVIGLGKNRPTFETGDLTITWFPTKRKIDPIYDAFLLSDQKASVFLATHGYDFEKSAIQIEKPVKLLISPFNEFKLPFYLGGMVSPGLKGLTELTSHLQPEHIVATHDEDKHAKGLVIRMAKIKRHLSKDLSKSELFKNRILDIPNYNPVEL